MCNQYLVSNPPICAHCKKIRDDEQVCQQLEVYISARTNANFGHGVCTACIEEHWGDLIESSE